MLGENEHPLAGFAFEKGGQCVNCRHYNGSGRCGAYPDGIPEAIRDDVISHTVPMPGDHGLRFEPYHEPPPPGTELP